VADNAKPRTHLPLWAVVWMVSLAVVALGTGVVAGIALQQTVELRDDLQSEVEKNRASTGLLTTLITTNNVGSEEVQRWIDSGLVRIPPRDPARSGPRSVASPATWLCGHCSG
jgi:hypothetical protein